MTCVPSHISDSQDVHPPHTCAFDWSENFCIVMICLGIGLHTEAVRMTTMCQ